MSKFTPHTVTTKKRKIRIINSPQKLKTYPVAAAAAVAAAWKRCSVHLGGHSPAACWAVDEFQNWTVFYVGDEQDKKCIRMWNSQLNLVRGKKLHSEIAHFWNPENWKMYFYTYRRISVMLRLRPATRQTVKLVMEFSTRIIVNGTTNTITVST